MPTMYRYWTITIPSGGSFRPITLPLKLLGNHSNSVIIDQVTMVTMYRYWTIIPSGGSFRPITLPLKLPGPDELSALPKGAVVLLHGGVMDRNLDTAYLRQETTDLRWSGDIPSAYPTGGYLLV